MRRSLIIALYEFDQLVEIGTFGGKELPAVKDVSFEVGAGEVLSLMGESGNGKRTRGKMILGLTSSSSGKIYFAETDISTLSREQQKEYYVRCRASSRIPSALTPRSSKRTGFFKILRTEFFPDMGDQEWSDRLNQALVAVGLNPEHVLNKYPHQ